MTEEIWKAVPGYEGKYEASTLGHVLETRTGAVLIPHRYDKNTSDKHMFVNLSLNAAGYTVGLHRVIATTFLPNPAMNTEVHHIDDNPENNAVNNLMWVSHIKNMRYIKSKNHVITVIDKTGKEKHVIYSLMALSQRIGVSNYFIKQYLTPTNKKDFVMWESDYEMLLKDGKNLYKKYRSEVKVNNGAKKAGRGKVQIWISGLTADEIEAVKQDVNDLSMRKFKSKYGKDKRAVVKALEAVA